MKRVKEMTDACIMEREKLETKYKDIIEINKSLSRQLVSFQANKKVPIYNWFTFKEGFSSEMVKLFIKEYPKKEGMILDPFAGSGTTLLSAREKGFDSLGIEIMPIGDFILKSKLIFETINLNRLSEEAKKLKKINLKNYPQNQKCSYNHIPITEKAFHPDTERKLNGFLNYISDLKDEEVKQIFSFACFCILEKISFTRKDGQCLRWDYRSKKGKSKFNKGKIFDFEEALFSQLNQIISDLRNMHIFCNQKKLRSKIELKSGSSLEILPQLEDNAFDMIISSPPYCNRYDYTRTYALELVYLGLNNTEIKELRQNLLSCTVENKDKIDFLKNISEKYNRTESFYKAEQIFKSNKALQEVLTLLELYKSEKKLNNPGISRMVKNYFYEHAFVILEMARLLKKGGRVYYVNDNVRYAGEVVPVDLILSEFAKKSGLTVKKIYKLQNGKGNSSQQMGTHGRQELRKCVYYWEK